MVAARKGGSTSWWQTLWWRYVMVADVKVQYAMMAVRYGEVVMVAIRYGGIG